MDIVNDLLFLAIIATSFALSFGLIIAFDRLMPEPPKEGHQ